MHARFSTCLGAVTVAACLYFASSVAAGAAADTKSWLDQPLAGWNTPGAPLPKALAGGESREQLAKRCKMTPRQSTPAEKALAEAGWIPLLHLDRQLVQGDVEIVDGVSGADKECQPANFNTFVFVGGRFAGTISPQVMTTYVDGVAGPVRILPNDVVRVDYSRYKEGDTPCCPSSHMVVQFQVDRSGSSPTVVPKDMRTTR